MRLAATPTLLAVALAASGARATDGLYLHAYGARSAGMGGATLASGDDALAQINNPASLSAAPKELALDLVYLRTDVHFENAGRYGPGVSGLAGTAFRNDEDASTDFKNFPFSDNNHFAPLLAGVYRFDESRAHMGPLRLRNLSFGASLYVVGGDAVRFELDHPVLGPRTRYRDNLVVSGASGTLSYRVNDWLAVGASVQGVGGRLRLQEPVAFPVSEIAVGTSAFLPAFGLSSYGGLFQAMGIDEGVSFNRFDHPGLALGVGGRFGVTLRPTSWLRVAVAYQTQRDMRFDGTMKLGFGAQIDQLRQIVLQNPQGLPFVSNLQDIVRFLGGALTPEAVDRSFQFLGIDPAQGFEQRYDTRIPLSLPRQVDVGIALQPSERLLLEFDYSWIQWSRAFRELRFSFRNGSNPNINALAGGTRAEFALPLGWKDQHVFRLGMRYALTPRLTVRMGYGYATHPIRPKGHILTIPVAGFHTLSTGFSYRLTPSVEASLAFERAFRRSIHVDQSDISSFHDHSDESTAEYTVQAGLRIALGGSPARHEEASGVAP